MESTTTAISIENKTVIKSFSDTIGGTVPTILTYIASNVLCINSDDLFSSLPAQTLKLKLWEPLSGDRRNALDQKLKNETETALKQINECILQIGIWREQIKKIKNDIKNPIKQDIYLKDLAQIQKKYKDLIRQYHWITNDHEFNTLRDNLTNRIAADNYCTMTTKSIDLMERCFDIAKGQFEQQLECFHQNTAEFEKLKDQFVQQWTALTQYTFTTWGVLTSFRKEFRSIYESIMEAKTSIGVTGRCINKLNKFGATKINIDDIDLTEYLPIENAEFENNENNIVTRLVVDESDLIEKSPQEEIVNIEDESEIGRKWKSYRSNYSDDVASFFDSIKEKLPIEERIWLEYKKTDDGYSSATIYPSIYQYIYFWNKIDGPGPKKMINERIKRRVKEILEAMESVIQKVNVWSVELSIAGNNTDELPAELGSIVTDKVQQPEEHKRLSASPIEKKQNDPETSSGEDEKETVQELICDSDIDSKVAKDVHQNEIISGEETKKHEQSPSSKSDQNPMTEEARKARLLKDYQLFQGVFEEMSENEIPRLYNSKLELEKDITELTNIVYCKAVSNIELLQITGAFDIDKDRLDKAFSSLHDGNAELINLRDDVLVKKDALVTGTIRKFERLFDEKIRKLNNQVTGWKEWIGYSSPEKYLNFPDKIQNLLSIISSSANQANSSSATTSSTTTASVTSLSDISDQSTTSSTTTMNIENVGARLQSPNIAISVHSLYSPPNESSFSDDIYYLNSRNSFSSDLKKNNLGYVGLEEKKEKNHESVERITTEELDLSSGSLEMSFEDPIIDSQNNNK